MFNHEAHEGTKKEKGIDGRSKAGAAEISLREGGSGLI